ncbi:hypothetical protein OCU04_011235 [Sclerotinia nivalis]|uniref:Antigenic cell wall galactomannoprotein n=1 Tax=Sclerotinia nivalis TaxID=352851 RepID=A0A9X0DEI6_9HELO|nr:hypothetical protein OCU04_011235 [Sclerotinia nivalis]
MVNIYWRRTSIPVLKPVPIFNAHYTTELNTTPIYLPLSRHIISSKFYDSQNVDSTMVSLKALFFYLASISVSVSAAPLTDRNLVTPDTLISDINNISNGVQALTTTLNSCNSKILDAAPIGLKFAAIHTSSSKAYIDAKLAAPANSFDSNRIVEFTFSNVGVEIPEAIRVLKTKKEDFSKVDLSVVVLVGLKLLRHDHDRFSEALVAKLTPDVVDRANEMVSVINEALQDGIDYFSS